MSTFMSPSVWPGDHARAGAQTRTPPRDMLRASWNGGSRLMTVQQKTAPASTSALEAGLVFIDGQLVPQEQATVSVLTHALHYGTSVFEGIRAYSTERGPAVFRLREH